MVKQTWIYTCNIKMRSHRTSAFALTLRKDIIDLQLYHLDRVMPAMTLENESQTHTQGSMLAPTLTLTLGGNRLLVSQTIWQIQPIIL